MFICLFLFPWENQKLAEVGKTYTSSSSINISKKGSLINHLIGFPQSCNTGRGIKMKNQNITGYLPASFRVWSNSKKSRSMEGSILFSVYIGLSSWKVALDSGQKSLYRTCHELCRKFKQQPVLIALPRQNKRFSVLMI